MTNSKVLSRIVVRLPNWIGDTVMALKAIHSLRVQYPDAHLVGMARPEHLDLVRRISEFDGVLATVPRTGRRLKREFIRVVRKLRNAHFDAAILLSPSFEAALSVYLGGVPLRVGHATDCRKILLNRIVPLREGHRADGFQDIVAALGAPVATGHGSLHLEEAERAYAQNILGSAGIDRDVRPIFLNPAAAKRPRAWPNERFVRLVDQIGSRHPGVPVIVHDQHPFDRPVDWPINGSVVIVSESTLLELTAIIERCSLYVGNDSGPMHIAAALGVPTIGIYGPSSPEVTSPRGLKETAHVPVSAGFPCSPCRERFFQECPSPPSLDERPVCLNDISVEQVVDAVDRILSQV